MKFRRILSYRVLLDGRSGDQSCDPAARAPEQQRKRGKLRAPWQGRPRGRRPNLLWTMAVDVSSEVTGRAFKHSTGCGAFTRSDPTSRQPWLGPPPAQHLARQDSVSTLSLLVWRSSCSRSVPIRQRPLGLDDVVGSPGRLYRATPYLRDGAAQRGAPRFPLLDGPVSPGGRTAALGIE